MNTLGNIIRKLRTEKDMTQGQLAKAAGMKQSDISKLELGTTQETAGIVRLAMALNANPIYLETGDSKYADLAPFDVVTIDAPAQDDVFIPISNACASMGYGREQPNFEQIVDYARVTRSWVRTELPYVSSADNLAILPALGPSMEPTFASGDLLLVDRGVTSIQNDAIYVFSLNDQTFVKRIIRNPVTRVMTAKSDNELHGSFDIDRTHAESLFVFGMIVYAWNAKKF